MECELRYGIGKIFVFILLIFISNGCSSLLVKRDITVSIPGAETAMEFYNYWEFEEAKKEFLILQEKHPADNNIKKILKDIEFRIEKKEEIKKIQENIKENITKNNFKNIKKYVDKTLSNILKLNEMEKYDFSKTQIFYSKIKFYKRSAQTVFLINYSEETVYFDVYFLLDKNNSWKITNIDERR